MRTVPQLPRVAGPDGPGEAVCAGLLGVFCDIDDTLTHHGRLVPAAFDALHRLQDAGIAVVPVTGRPAGWVDQIARLWPVDGVVGENGGLWAWMGDTRLERRYLQPGDVRTANRARLEALGAHILREVPGSALASDQAFRALDLAVDFCEDVPALSDDAIDRIVALFEEAGATAKVSSIHVNGWFGSFDKLTGCARLVADRWGRVLDEEAHRWLYVGDSANDEPMFARFPHTVGVANVARFLPRMRAHPRWIADGDGGHGFAEIVDHVLGRRSGRMRP